MDVVEFKTEPGYIGHFTRHQERGAYRNGSRVMKINSELGDGHKNGELATVVGSFCAGDGYGTGYFVEWDICPRVIVFVGAYRITKVEAN